MLVMLLLIGLRVATQSSNLPESLNLSDKFIHFFVFFCFTFLADLVSSREPFWFWKALPLAAYGFGVEVLQYFSLDRSFSLMDALADFSGILVYWLLKQLIYMIAQRRSASAQSKI
ncbi:VanZ family protein [Leucothrix arctica]|uniref:VanZ family protein n=2 Tax=Leucothrix arctica TaxID=1481894 RepID=A0A317C864_9GAMM|nr:VanZ family protein [Leucothrix arctica]